MDTLLDMQRKLSPRKLEKALRAKGWTQKDLAYHAGLSLPTVAAIFSEESGGRVTSILAIADALEIRDLNTLVDTVS